MGGAFFRLLKPITIYNMDAVTAIVIAVIIGIVVLCLIARDIGKEVQRDKGQSTR